MLGMNILCSSWTLVAPDKNIEHFPIYDTSLYLLLILTVACGFFYLASISKSMQYNTVGVVQVILYLAIPFGYFLDWLFFGLSIGNLEIWGAVLICLLNIVIAVLRIKNIIS